MTSLDRCCSGTRAERGRRKKSGAMKKRAKEKMDGENFFYFYSLLLSRDDPPTCHIEKGGGEGGRKGRWRKAPPLRLLFRFPPSLRTTLSFRGGGSRKKSFSSLLWVFSVRGLPTPSSIFGVYARSLPVPSLRGAKGSVHEKDSGFFPLFSRNVCVCMSTRKEIGGNHIISFPPIPPPLRSFVCVTTSHFSPSPSFSGNRKKQETLLLVLLFVVPTSHNSIDGERGEGDKMSGIEFAAKSIIKL